MLRTQKIRCGLTVFYRPHKTPIEFGKKIAEIRRRVPNGARQQGRLNALLTSLEKIKMTFESKTLTELSLFQC
jgi:hypothetical protein